MIYRIEISPLENSHDARSTGLHSQIQALGIDAVTGVEVLDLVFLDGDDLGDDAVEDISQRLLLDPVVEQVRWSRVDAPVEELSNLRAFEPSNLRTHLVEVVLLPGVTDTAAENLVLGAEIIGRQGVRQAALGQRYVIHGALAEAEVRRVAEGLLANGVIQTYAVDRPVTPPLAPLQETDHVVEQIPLRGADDEALEQISLDRRLSLNLQEMQAIRAYYQEQDREPTDLELEMLAQTWSEHCVHKTFRATIHYTEEGQQGEQVIESMLKTYIRGATDKANKDWVHSAFVDNAGIVAFDEELDLAFKVETHNHPSALEPFGGANTGVGGVVRDVMGVSARPIATTDVLCFGPQDMAFEDLPKNVLHPRRIADGVTAGVEDYGNKMGIPTVNGAILYHPGYTSNPLVFCGCMGVLPRGSHPTSPQPGDLVVSLGGRTGRDGLRGATFSSMEMTHETGQVAGSAVQIGHPIQEKQVLEVQLLARDEELYTAITDCGAGGLSSAVGEMGEELGAEVQLADVPLKYAGLQPWEIWLSEAQERMVMAVPPENWPRLQQLCQRHDVEATALGTFTGDGHLTVRHGEQQVGRLSTQFLHHGLPPRSMNAHWTPPALQEPDLPRKKDLTTDLLALLADPIIRSKEDVVRRYDHEVQGGTVVKPLVGEAERGPGDAAVLVPLEAATAPGGCSRGVALSAGVNPFYGEIDPYAMAWAAVDEAMRNCVAVGADPELVSILDNFCWGNPNKPDRLAGLVRCARGCHDAAVAHGVPFISGKDSLHNEYADVSGQRLAIPGTLLISAMGIVPDVNRTCTMDLKEPGNLLYVVGQTAAELGGSAYYRGNGHVGASVPAPAEGGPALMRAMHLAIKGGLLRACHDCSEGGLAVAAAEMALAGRLGLSLDLRTVPLSGELDRDDALAFSESSSRFVAEVTQGNAAAFEACLAGLPLARAGEVRDDGVIALWGLGGAVVIETTVEAAELAWRGHLE